MVANIPQCYSHPARFSLFEPSRTAVKNDEVPRVKSENSNLARLSIRILLKRRASTFVYMVSRAIGSHSVC